MAREEDDVPLLTIEKDEPLFNNPVITNYTLDFKQEIKLFDVSLKSGKTAEAGIHFANAQSAVNSLTMESKGFVGNAAVRVKILEMIQNMKSDMLVKKQALESSKQKQQREELGTKVVYLFLVVSMREIG